MATPQTFRSLLRAVRPSFRSRTDRLAFAVHSYLVLDGKRLIATGRAASGDVAGLDSGAPDASLEGWNELGGGRYAFLYADEAGKEAPLLVSAKEEEEGGVLSLRWEQPGGGQASGSLALPLAEYTTDSQDLVEGYQRLGDLLSTLQRGFYAAAEGGAAEKLGAGTDALSSVPQQGSPARAPGEALDPGLPMRPESKPLQRERERDPLMVGGPRRPQPDPFFEGAIPGLGDPFSAGGLPRPGGRGMHVGPDDPIFRQRFGEDGERPDAEGDLPPGARWDPISGPGTQGFRPGDFTRRAQRGPGGLHPDIMPKGPGGPGGFGGGGFGGSGFGGGNMYM